jgi:cytochrome c556
MTRSVLLAVATAVGLLSALPAAAQFQKPEDAVKYRKAAFTVMAAHFGRIGAMAQGRVPFDGAAAAANAEIVADMAKLPFAGFVEGTGGSEKGMPKANVWTERAKFDAGAKKMQEETAKLAESITTPVIASGGVASLDDLLGFLDAGGPDASGQAGHRDAIAAYVKALQPAE